MRLWFCIEKSILIYAIVRWFLAKSKCPTIIIRRESEVGQILQTTKLLTLPLPRTRKLCRISYRLFLCLYEHPNAALSMKRARTSAEGKMEFRAYSSSFLQCLTTWTQQFRHSDSVSIVPCSFILFSCTKFDRHPCQSATSVLNHWKKNSQKQKCHIEWVSFFSTLSSDFANVRTSQLTARYLTSLDLDKSQMR